MQILGLKPSLLRKFIWHQKERNELAEPWKEDTKAGMNTVSTLRLDAIFVIS